MKPTILILTLVTIAALAGCMDSGSRSEAGALGQMRRSEDTLGTQRRMDVYGGATAPVLPTMGARGYGK